MLTQYERKHLEYLRSIANSLKEISKSMNTRDMEDQKEGSEDE